MGMSREERESIFEVQTALVPKEFTEENNDELFGIEPEKAVAIKKGLSTTLAEREVLKDAYLDVIGLEISTETVSIFKDLRLKILKNRTQGIETWHKNEKAFYLAGGKFVDAIKNKEIAVNKEMEDKLLEGEKFFERQEAEKATVINNARIERIKPFVEDVTGLDFSAMNDYDFDDYVLGKKTRFEAEKAAAEKAEADRIEAEKVELARQKAIEIENAKLKAEADKAAAALAKERAEAKAKQDAIELKAKQEREKAEKEVLEERERTFKKVRELRSEACDFLIEKGFEKTSDHGGMYWFNIGGCKQSVLNYKESNLYFEKHDALDTFKKLVSAEVNFCLSEAKLKAKADAELARIAAENKASAELAKAPVKNQLSVWVESFELPPFATENKTSEEIFEKFEAFKKWSLTQINSL